MLVGGGNNYKLAHIGKEGLRKIDQLPDSLKCSLDAMETARNLLRDSNIQK
jgi:hypothetical protein